MTPSFPGIVGVVGLGPVSVPVLSSDELVFVLVFVFVTFTEPGDVGDSGVRLNVCSHPVANATAIMSRIYFTYSSIESERVFQQE
jgi:hypothetical protein